MAHTIRLAGPWEYTLDGESWERCVLPLEVDQQRHLDGFCLRRKFHRPTGLDEGSTVAIVVSASEPPGLIRLNDDVITSAEAIDGSSTASYVFDVTDRLQEFNTVLLFRTVDGRFPSRIDAVALQITEPAGS